MEEPGLNRVIRAAYRLLGCKLTYGRRQEVRAWTIRVGDTAQGGGGYSHGLRTWFYSRATISYDDFVAYKGEQGAKEAGKMRSEGKDYVVEDGDVLNFCLTSDCYGWPGPRRRAPLPTLPASADCTASHPPPHRPLHASPVRRVSASDIRA